MRAKKIFLIMAGLVVAGTMGNAWHEVRVNREKEQQLAAAMESRMTVDASIQRMETRCAAAENECAEFRAALDVISKTDTGATAAAADAKPDEAVAKIHEFLELLLKDPQMQNLQLSADRIEVANTYAPLLRMLRLTPEQGEKFLANALDHRARETDIGTVMRLQEMKVDDPVLAKLRKQSEEDYAAAQRAILGESGYRQFQEYERTSEVRDVVRGLAGAATIAGTPFTRQQAEQLMQILANASSSYRSGKPTDVGEIDWRSFDQQASGVLSGPQLKLIQTVEPSGPYGGGARFLTRMSTLIGQAWMSDDAQAKVRP